MIGIKNHGMEESIYLKKENHFIYRMTHPEQSYLELLDKVYHTGERRDTRNGVTYSLFGERIEFDISKHGFPLLTTKKMFWKGIVEELCWFLRADTNTEHLKEKGIHIWDGNTSRKVLDGLGLTDYPDGCAGPIYGFQWRNFNGEYKPNSVVELETCRDQLYTCIQQIKNDPTSRRILFSGWNPVQQSQMCLPPCHVLYQFYVQHGKLDCQMYQRSADLFLGLPFNIASTALLTLMMAHITNYKVGKISICLGDVHLYEEHRERVVEQLTRVPFPFPKVHIREKKEKIEDIQPSDILLDDYICHGALRAPMLA